MVKEMIELVMGMMVAVVVLGGRRELVMGMVVVAVVIGGGRELTCGEKASSDCKLWREGERCASVGAEEEERWLFALFSRDCL